MAVLGEGRAIFGPIASVIRGKDYEEALGVANASFHVSFRNASSLAASPKAEARHIPLLHMFWASRCRRLDGFVLALANGKQIRSGFCLDLFHDETSRNQKLRDKSG